MPLLARANPTGDAAFALLCACCAHAPDRGVRIRERADGVDWQRVAAMARRHRVQGLVAQALRYAGVRVPPDLAQEALRIAQTSLAQSAESLRIQALFRNAGIAVCFLKGAALAYRLYGSVAARQSIDIDAMVPVERVPDCWAILASEGYTQRIPAAPLSGHGLRAFMRASKDSTHHHAAKRLVLELHWRISDIDGTTALATPATWQDVAIVPGRSLTTLGDEALFVYLCAHGSGHAWSRLKWLADIDAMLTSASDGGAALWRAAMTCGAQRSAATAILLAHDLLGTSLPPGFHPKRSYRLDMLLALSRHMLRPRDGDPELRQTRWRAIAEPLAALLAARSVRAAMSVLGRLTIPAEDIALLQLPRHLAFLYPVARVPLWVWKRSRWSPRT